MYSVCREETPEFALSLVLRKSIGRRIGRRKTSFHSETPRDGGEQPSCPANGIEIATTPYQPYSVALFFYLMAVEDDIAPIRFDADFERNPPPEYSWGCFMPGV